MGLTRELLLSAAERLFAEHGVAAVSNRRISEAAGQGNNTAVGYHFDGRDDLVRTIVRKHHEQIEHHRAEMLARLSPDAGVREQVACMLRPVAQHLTELGSPTWYGRFNAQVMTDPHYRDVAVSESLSSPSLARISDQLVRCLPELPRRCGRSAGTCPGS